MNKKYTKIIIFFKLVFCLKYFWDTEKNHLKILIIISTNESFQMLLTSAVCVCVYLCRWQGEVVRVHGAAGWTRANPQVYSVGTEYCSHQPPICMRRTCWAESWMTHTHTHTRYLWFRGGRNRRAAAWWQFFCGGEGGRYPGHLWASVMSCSSLTRIKKRETLC